MKLPTTSLLTTSHTLARYENAFYAPLVSDWRNFETWREDGSKTATMRANAIWKKLLKEHELPPLDSGAAAALEAYVAKRKEEIAAGVDVPV
jgi:trimethylamine--corrinoid protein Co-methyltransferase